MKVTRANVAEYAEKHGLELLPIDGIPRGFSFFHRIGISGKDGIRMIHVTLYAFVPLVEFDEGKITLPADMTVTSKEGYIIDAKERELKYQQDQRKLLDLYNKKLNGK